MAGSTISGTVTTGIILGDGSYPSPLRITPTGAIVPSTYGVTGLLAGIDAGYVLNEGLVSGGLGSASTTGGTGVYLAAGTLTNNGTTAGGAGTDGSGGGTGVDLAGGTLVNQATIVGGAGNASGVGGHGVNVASGSLANYGVVRGGDGADGGIGVYLTSTSLTNRSTIVGGNGDTGGSGGAGVVFLTGGTLTNFGSIGGGNGSGGNGDAISFGSGTSRLILVPGASLNGAAFAVAGFGNVLELPSAANAGTLNGGIGAAYQGFETIVVDAGATWTLSGTSTLAAGGSLLVQGRLTNTGTITGGAGGNGVDLSGGTLINRQSITAGVGAPGAAGVAVTAGIITNYGTIAGGSATGVVFANGGTLIDVGSISGSPAVDFGSGAAHLVLEPGAQLSGSVITDAAFSNVLELAGTSAATLTGGLGSQYQNFGTIVVDTNANWTLAAANNVVAVGASVTSSGTLTVKGSLTNDGVITATTKSVNRLTGAIVDIGSVTNNGTITGGPVTVAGTAGAGVYVRSSSLNNTSVINGGYGGSSGGIGVKIGGSGSSLTNSGTITGGFGILNGRGGRGVSLVAGSITSSGTIIGGNGGSKGQGNGGAGAAGAYVETGGLTNTGAIIGGAGARGGYGNGFGGTGGDGVDVQSGALSNSGTISGGSAGIDWYGGYSRPGGTGVNFLQAGSLINNGTIIGGVGTGGTAVAFAAGGTLTNAGFISGTMAVAFFGSASRLILEPGAQLNGSIFAAGLGNVLELGTGAGTITDLGGTVIGFSAIDFDDSAAWFVGGNTAGLAAGQTIEGFVAGDTIELTGFVSTRHSFTSDGLILSNSSISETIGIQGSFSSGDFNITDDGTNSFIQTDVICFAAGTRIATPAGEIPVEALSVGDRVTTLRGEAQPIVWIGVGKVLATRGRRGPATPVIVKRGALGNNVPHRDLRVTKGHSLFIDGALIPVEELINHRSILWDDRAQELTIYHIELEKHDVLLADGAPAESYRDDGNRWLFQNANSGWCMAPKEPCAPILTGGPVVDAIWRRLLDRAGPRRGLPLTFDPDLHLLFDGRRLDAVHQDGDAYIFQLPAPPVTLRIISRAAIPAELGMTRDHRLLGVAIRNVTARQGIRSRTIVASDARLSAGFHAFEPDNGFRWTDGDAAVPAGVLADFAAPLELKLHVRATTGYIDEGHARRSSQSA